MWRKLTISCCLCAKSCVIILTNFPQSIVYMGYLLYIFYFLLFCFLIHRVKIFTSTGLDGKLLIVFFLVRIVCSFLNSYINLYHYPFSDTRAFHEQGVIEFSLLVHDPKEYFTNIFRSNYEDYSRFMESSHSFWNDTRTNVIAKILSIFNIFSGKNFFINTLFFNFLVFAGSAYLYKFFVRIFPLRPRLVTCCVFLLPSVIYFTSGIHRDGLIFLSLCILFYNLYFVIVQRQFHLKSLFLVFASLSLILLLRNFVFITLVPILIAWFFSTRSFKYPLFSYLMTLGLSAVIFFATSLIPGFINLAQHVSTKQAEFIELGKLGESSMEINTLYPSIKSFLLNAPQAINHSLMRPYVFEKFSLLYLPLAIEMFAYQIIILLALFFSRKIASERSTLYMSLFFSLSMFLIIGYTIPILGALVRYRSIFFPFLITPLICIVKWERIGFLLRIRQ